MEDAGYFSEQCLFISSIELCPTTHRFAGSLCLDSCQPFSRSCSVHDQVSLIHVSHDEIFKVIHEAHDSNKASCFPYPVAMLTYPLDVFRSTRCDAIPALKKLSFPSPQMSRSQTRAPALFSSSWQRHAHLRNAIATTRFLPGQVL